jgi:hypothetical protein
VKFDRELRIENLLAAGPGLAYTVPKSLAIDFSDSKEKKGLGRV